MSRQLDNVLLEVNAPGTRLLPRPRQGALLAGTDFALTTFTLRDHHPDTSRPSIASKCSDTCWLSNHQSL
jgi:hypothetical protein